MTGQCWAFVHKHCTFNGFVVLFKNLQIRVAYGKVSFTLTGRLLEKQFIVCNFTATIFVDLWVAWKKWSNMEDQLYLKYHCKVFHLLCTQHYTSICMNPRYSGKRN